MTLFSRPSARLSGLATTSAVALFAGAVAAQDSNIQLLSEDGALSIEGEFIGFRDGIYVVDHATLGTLRIEATDQISCLGAACPLDEPVVEEVAAPVTTQVMLTTGDGRLTVEGSFIELTSDSYIIDSPTLGRLAIELHPDIECIGEACPIIAPAYADKLIVGPAREISVLLPPLLEAYATTLGASVTVGSVNEDGQVPVILMTSGDTVAAEYLIQSAGTQDALARLGASEASLVIADRRILDTEVDSGLVADLRASDGEFKLAEDGLVLVTHPSNPVRSLSAAQISAIWSGETDNWVSVGGGERPVSVNALISDVSDAQLFARTVLRGAGGTAASATNHPDLQAFLAAMGNEGAIGVARRADVLNSELRMVDLQDSCGLLSSPTDFSIKNDGYLLQKEVYAYFDQDSATAELSGFAEWIASDAAQDIISAQNYVTSAPGRMALQDMGLTLIHTAAVEPDFSGVQFADTMRALRSAERTSIAFRFDPGSSNLDQDSVIAVNEMAERLAAGTYAGFDVVLVGFSDSSGPAASNTVLAQNRAVAVQNALQGALPANVATSVAVSALSAGELMPMSCNNTEAGRQNNRRVEAWIRLSQ